MALPLGDVDRGRVAIAEVYGEAFFLGNGRGERHLDSRALDSAGIFADAADVRRMRQHAPWVMLEPLPLAQEVRQAVIADLADDLPMHDGYFRNVRSVDYQLAPVGDDGLHLVHALGADPKFIVHPRRAGQHGLERLVHVGDVSFV